MFRILLIEDNLPAQTELAEAIRALNIEVDTASIPREIYDLLEKSETHPYDLVLTDYWIMWESHRIGGDHIYKEIRLSCGKTIPIIAASSDMSMWEELKAKKNDPHLHLIAKMSRGTSSFWNQTGTLQLITQILQV